MPNYEYHVVPAPKRGEKAKGLKTTEERFAHALTGLMNQLGADGWDYVRADCLPCEERQGLTGRTTTFQNVLVFRRAIEAPMRETAGLPPSAPATAPAVDGPRTGSAPALGPARPDGPQMAEGEDAPPQPETGGTGEPDPDAIGRTLTATRD